MNILLTGSTGLVGKALSTYLKQQGHHIYPLHRNPLSKNNKHYWFPKENRIHLDNDIKLDAVIHLAGENIADMRWSHKKKDDILNSRVDGTLLLAKTLAELEHKPKVLISASAIGYYGDTADNIVDEKCERGSGFLSDIATLWEAATREAELAGIRTIHIRTGIVLSTHGGVLAKMLLPFKIGLGGVVGNGKQYMSWVSINDVVVIIETMLNDNSLSGAFNLVAPTPVTNYTFTNTLGHTLNRPTFFPLPAIMARLIFGEMADALLLSSSRVSPTRLQSYGYKFIDDELQKTLSGLLKDNK